MKSFEHLSTQHINIRLLLKTRHPRNAPSIIMCPVTVLYRQSTPFSDTPIPAPPKPCLATSCHQPCQNSGQLSFLLPSQGRAAILMAALDKGEVVTTKKNWPTEKKWDLTTKPWVRPTKSWNFNQQPEGNWSTIGKLINKSQWFCPTGMLKYKHTSKFYQHIFELNWWVRVIRVNDQNNGFEILKLNSAT